MQSLQIHTSVLPSKYSPLKVIFFNYSKDILGILFGIDFRTSLEGKPALFANDRFSDWENLSKSIITAAFENPCQNLTTGRAGAILARTLAKTVKFKTLKMFFKNCFFKTLKIN